MTISSSLKLQRHATSFSAWRTLAILVVLYFLSLLDRQILSLLVLPIQADLHLSDTELGAIQGLAFVLFYSVMGVALAWLVDKYSRRWIVFFGVVIWSVSTFACGLAPSFGALFAARLGVGFGEAVLGPAAASLLGALFPRHRLSLASGIYTASASMGGLAAFWLGGILVSHLNAQGGLIAPFVGHLKPWQAVFCLAGAAGLPLAVLAFFMSDPRHSDDTSTSRDSETLSSFARRRGLLWTCQALAFGVLTMTAYASISWTPAYLGRAFGADPASIGLVMGLAFGVCGIVANIFWGFIIDRMSRGGIIDAPYRIYFFLVPVGIPVAILAYTIPSFLLSSVLICAMWLIMMGGIGPLAAATLLFTPPHLRGRASAAASLASGVLAIGLTPFLIGVITDYVFHDRAKVGLSIASFIAVFGLLGVTILFFARKRLADAILEEYGVTPQPPSEVALPPAAYARRLS